MTDVNEIDPVDHGNDVIDTEIDPVDQSHEATYPWLYGLAILLYSIVVGIIIILAPAGYRWMTFATLVLLTALMFRQRSSSDLWLYRFMGMNMFVYKGGPMFELPGVRAHPLTKARRQRQFPEEPENVYHGDDKDALPLRTDGLGYKMRPFRVVTGAPEPGYDSHLNIQMTLGVTGTVRYHIDQEHPFDFWIRIPGHTDEEKFRELERQMMDTWGKTVIREFEKLPVGRVIEYGSRIRTDLRKDLADRIKGLSIVLDEVNLESPDLSHDLSGKLADIGSARAASEATRVTADATGYKTRVEGQGKADARLADMKAEGDGVAYQAEKMGIDGRMVFAAQTAERVIGGKDKVIFGADGIAQAIAAGKVIVTALDTNNEADGAK